MKSMPQMKRLTSLWALFYGAPKEIRTPDPLVRSQVLYPAELWAHAQYYTRNSMFLKAKIAETFGGERGIRTLDTDLSPYASLAGKCLRPLGQLSVLNQLRYIARARYYAKLPYKSIHVAN